MSTWAVIPAAGRGERFGGSTDKLLSLLMDQPVLAHTVSAFLRAERIDGLVLAVHPDKRTAYEQILGALNPSKPVRWTTGGVDRRESVYRGLLALPETATRVAVHDAARPLIRPALIDAAVTALDDTWAGVVVGLPMPDTVKLARPDAAVVERTVDRQHLWRVQTPQVFHREGLLQAHREVPPDVSVTDDAQLLECAGMGPVVLWPGDAWNLKITTPDDLRMAEAWLRHHVSLHPAV